jgi:hypothetical protein
VTRDGGQHRNRNPRRKTVGISCHRSSQARASGDWTPSPRIAEPEGILQPRDVMALVFLGLFFATFLFDTRIGAGFLLVAIVLLCRGGGNRRVARARDDRPAPAQSAWKDPWTFTSPGPARDAAGDPAGPAATPSA